MDPTSFFREQREERTNTTFNKFETNWAEVLARAAELVDAASEAKHRATERIAEEARRATERVAEIEGRTAEAVARTELARCMASNLIELQREQARDLAVSVHRAQDAFEFVYERSCEVGLLQRMFAKSADCEAAFQHARRVASFLLELSEGYRERQAVQAVLGQKAILDAFAGSQREGTRLVMEVIRRASPETYVRIVDRARRLPARWNQNRNEQDG